MCTHYAQLCKASSSLATYFNVCLKKRKKQKKKGNQRTVWLDGGSSRREWSAPRISYHDAKRNGNVHMINYIHTLLVCTAVVVVHRPVCVHRLRVKSIQFVQSGNAHKKWNNDLAICMPTLVVTTYMHS